MVTSSFITASSTLATSTTPSPTTAPLSQITNPAFYGYTSLEIVENTVVYSSVNCFGQSTFTASGSFPGYASCCAGSCALFTGCQSGTILAGPASTLSCTGPSSCVTDTFYDNLSGATYALHCSVGFGNQWSRQLPQGGVSADNSTAIGNLNKAQSSIISTNSAIAIGICGFLFLVAIGLAFRFRHLCGCGGGGGGGGGWVTSEPIPLTAREARQQTKKDNYRQYKENAHRENMERQNDLREQARKDYLWSQQNH